MREWTLINIHLGSHAKVSCLGSLPSSGARKLLWGFVATQAGAVTTAAQGETCHYWHRGRSLGKGAEDCISNSQRRAALPVHKSTTTLGLTGDPCQIDSVGFSAGRGLRENESPLPSTLLDRTLSHRSALLPPTPSCRHPVPKKLGCG